jgi:hypothetical protein
MSMALPESGVGQCDVDAGLHVSAVAEDSMMPAACMPGEVA